MSSQVYSNETEIYPQVESSRFLIDKITNKKIVMEGPPQVGDILEIVAVSNGTYEDPEVARFKSVAEVVADNLVKTKGGLLTNDGLTAVELPVGTDRNVLQANSLVADGIEWTDNVLLNTLEVSNQLKTNAINPIGAGPIFIDGSTLNVFSPGNDVHCNVGWVAGAPPTNNATLHIEGNGNSGLLIDGGDDGSGVPFIEMRGETRDIALSAELDAGSNNAIIQASSINTLPKNDIIFKVGGQYPTDPGLDNRTIPVGGVEAFKINGTTSNIEVENKIVNNNGIQIGDGTTSAPTTTGIALGKGAVATNPQDIVIGHLASSTTGSRSIGIGQGCVANGQDTVCIGTTAQTSFTDAIAIGRNSNAGHARTICIGSGAVSSGAGQLRLGSATSVLNLSGTANPGGATLPANPVTFLDLWINGNNYKIPLYNP